MEIAKILKSLQDKDFKTFVNLTKSIRKYKNCLKAHHFHTIEKTLEIKLSDVKLESLNGFDTAYEGTFVIQGDYKVSQSDEVLVFLKLLLAIFLERNKFELDSQKLLYNILALIKA